MGITVTKLALIQGSLTWGADTFVRYSIDNAVLCRTNIMVILSVSLHWSPVCVDAEYAHDKNAAYKKYHACCPYVNPGPSCANYISFFEVALHEY